MQDQDPNPQISLEGEVYRIIFNNSANNYMIFVLGLKNHSQVTVTGTFLELEPGDKIRIIGKYVRHKTYGRQFSTISYEVLLPKSTDAISKFLESTAIDSIGPALANRIVNKFGEKTLEIMENDPEKLLSVTGVGEKVLKKIKLSFAKTRELRNLMLFCHSHNISSSQSVRIYKVLGDNSIMVLKKNPYRLIELIHGIGFLTADTMAQNMGVPLDHPYRLESLILHLLKEELNRGHCFTFLETLNQEFEKYSKLDGPERFFRESLHRLLEKEEIIWLQDQGDRIYLKGIYHIENEVGDKLKLSLKGASSFNKNKALKDLKSILKEEEFEYSKDQIQAVKILISNKLSILSGGPGTGKSTLLNLLLKVAKKSAISVKLAAPTGMAAKRMSVASDFSASTLHRLLEFDPETGDFKRGNDNPLKCRLLVIDEFSMVDLLMFAKILRGISADTQLILIGDPDQLPSIGPGALLADLINSAKVPHATLEQIFRQGAGSTIVKNARAILNASPFEEGYNEDFQFVSENDSDRLFDILIKAISEYLPQEQGLDPVWDVQVLCPMKNGPLGSKRFNEKLALLLNKNSRLKCGSKEFAIGDKVLETQNDYPNEVFNGNIGCVKEIDEKNKTVTINFEGRPVSYDFFELDTKFLAYAITVHKSQGSEYPAVVMPFHSCHFPMLRKNLIYTGITRAKKLCYLGGNLKAFQITASRKRRQERRTSLQNILSGQKNETLKSEI